MILESELKEVVAYVYDYLDNVECNCTEGGCWYHLNDTERVAFLTRGALEVVKIHRQNQYDNWKRDFSRPLKEVLDEVESDHSRNGHLS